ncbi:hypothetical protein SK128_010537 [Halocaridina rubra]|uniref:Uncharacterized protein n=1 Tax=Halocaridina rubra TaxID=373956 RepID=A0AAN9AE79_HALRR
MSASYYPILFARRQATQFHSNEKFVEPYIRIGVKGGQRKMEALKEGVAKWTFPARESATFIYHSASSWQPQTATSSWPLHYVQQPIPDMEGVVSQELQRRIEAILSYPLGGLPGVEDCPEESPSQPKEYPPENQNEDYNIPVGGLLQDYLDHLYPEEEDEAENDLMFQRNSSLTFTRQTTLTLLTDQIGGFSGSCKLDKHTRLQ